MQQNKDVRSVTWCRMAISLFMSLASFAGMLICRGFVHYNGVIYRKRVVFFVLLMLATIVVSTWSLDEKKRWKHSRLSFALTCIIAGGFAFQYITCAVSDYVISLSYLPLMLSLSAVIYVAVWLLTCDSRRAGVWYYWLMLIAGYAYECVYLFRGITFKPMDILSFGTAMAVAGAYSYPLEAKHLFWLQGGIFLWGLSGIVRKQKNVKRERWVKLISTVLSACWIWLLVSTTLLSDWNVISTAFESDAPYYNRIQGTLSTLMKECQQLRSIRPQDYPADGIQPEDERLNAVVDLSGGSRPNVIVVMNESLADLQSQWQISCDADPLAGWHSMSSSTISGNLLVSAYGGSTCNTEHSFLTSTIPAPQLNAALYSNVKKETPSLAWQLKSMGYSAIAIHPNDASNYQRDQIYPRLGFDDFLSIDDFEGADMIRELVSDQACYERILHLLNEKGDEERLFIFNVTMQNHGGYRNREMAHSLRLAPEINDPELEQYLNLVAESDRALQNLIAGLAAFEEPTVLLVFGDHQPNLDLLSYPLLEQSTQALTRLAQYVTPYLIWANYPLQPSQAGDISVNYLAPLLLQTAGLPLTGYDEWLLDVMQDYPVVVLSGYADSAGTFTEWDAAEWPQELQLMNHLRYNRLYDAEHRLPALGFANE